MSSDEQGQVVMARSEASGEQLVAVVQQLVRELHPGKSARLVVRLDSDLDRDLGLDSLGRAELLHRLERAFGARLPEALIAEATTPGDLLEGVLAATTGHQAIERVTSSPRAALATAGEPRQARTLLEAFAAHVAATPSRPHVHLWLSDDEERTLTYGDLDLAARRAAAGLLQLDLQPGDRVALMLPTSADFFVAFMAVLMAGAVPVPVYPPFRRAQIEEHVRRQAGILRNAGARAIIMDAETRPLGSLLTGLVEDLRAATTVVELSHAAPIPQPMTVTSDATALIQYTSGSTGDPKGVVLTHANLLANVRAMGEALQANSQDVFVSWLPLYHDMGLIGAWLSCLYYAVPTAIMSPLSFLAKPARWLWSLHRHRGTLSAAPNFAFELCLRSIRDEDIEGLDLSALRWVLNGAEPISASTMARFTERFAAYGFKPEAMAPVYGLAECSVGLAFPPLGRRPPIDRVQRAALARDGRAIPAREDDTAVLELVACGRPLPRHQIRIVDDAGRELPDRRQGRLQFKGPSTTRGYFQNAERTQALFDGDWLESGDLAYIADGDVYLTGRLKDMIIRAGRNIYPHELEDAVGNLDGVRKGCVAVFASADARSQSERLVVMAETRRLAPADQEKVKAAITQVSMALLETPPDEIALVPPRTVPKTSSGKIRRTAARALFEGGTQPSAASAPWLQIVRLGVQGLGPRARRTLHRTRELAYAGWWWTVLVALGACTWPLVMLAPGQSGPHRVVGAAGRLFLRMTGTPLKVSGSSTLPAGGVMMVSNHASYLDGLVLRAAVPGTPVFIAKHELQGQRVAGPFLRRLATIFVRRIDPKEGMEDAGQIVRAARAGAQMVVMAEGTFSRMPGLLPFRLGAFLAAAEAGIPVVPVTLRGTRMILRGDQWMPRHGQVQVDIGAPLYPDGSDFAAAVRLRDRCRAAILARSGEPDLAHERIELT